jgi:hypothetical protein
MDQYGLIFGVVWFSYLFICLFLFLSPEFGFFPVGQQSELPVTGTEPEYWLAVLNVKCDQEKNSFLYKFPIIPLLSLYLQKSLLSPIPETFYSQAV